jgi:hypothetical protein
LGSVPHKVDERRQRVFIPTLAYLAEGKLYLVEPQKEARLIDSHFAQEVLDRQERNRERHDWKGQGMAWQFTQMPMGMRVPDTRVRQINFAGVARGASNEGQIELVYALRNGPVGGLFVWTASNGFERRLLHRNQFVPTDLARHPIDGTLSVSLRLNDGTANIGVINPEGKGLREMTEGDSVDECPSWAGGNGRVLVYQSSGVGRNAAGIVAALGPYAIMRLDLDSSDLSMLIDSESHDHLAPRLSADGSLYFIRRPYQATDHVEVSPLKVAKDILFFPFRLIAAIVHFLDWFSLVFRRKPLITTGGPAREGPDARYMMLWGKLIDAEKALREGKGDSTKSLVPKTWELVRRAQDGSEKVLMKGIIAFDLCDDGGVVYTNGMEVHQLDNAGNDRLLCTGKLIERVIVAR